MSHCAQHTTRTGAHCAAQYLGECSGTRHTRNQLCRQSARSAPTAPAQHSAPCSTQHLHSTHPSIQHFERTHQAAGRVYLISGQSSCMISGYVSVHQNQQQQQNEKVLSKRPDTSARRGGGCSERQIGRRALTTILLSFSYCTLDAMACWLQPKISSVNSVFSLICSSEYWSPEYWIE